MNERFNNSFQNTVPYQGDNMNPYLGQDNQMPQDDQAANQYNQMPYNQAMDSAPPLYPLQTPLVNPTTNAPVTGAGFGYAKGGKVKKNKKKGPQMNPFPSLAEMIRQEGEGEDQVLAHINPIEAQMLSVLSNGGSINPVTGLPQFGLFNKPGKWLKSMAGGTGGAIIGNMILPGIGGVIGGALGGAAGNAMRGRQILPGALKGATIGAILPSAAGFAGSGLSALGARAPASFLTQYGANNAILPALSRMISPTASSAPSLMTSSMPSMSANATSPMGISPSGAAAGGGRSWADSLITNSKDFLTKPKNLLTLASIAGSFANRPKPQKPPREKSPEELADEHKRYKKSLMLTPQERAEREAGELADVQAQRRIARNQFLPEERIGPIDPLYTKTHTPEEYRRHGKWLSYYNNPEFTGEPVLFNHGGSTTPHGMFEEQEVEYPSGLGYYIKGDTGGQDDEIEARVSDGEFVIPADVVAHAGDGNNAAGAKKFYKLMENIRKHKGGRIKLPPKAKSLADYMR